MADPIKEVDASVGNNSENPACAYWRKELDLALQRTRPFLTKAQAVTRLYEGDKRDENSFNVLYSNTNILLPACYNQLPRPFVDRRFKDPDPQAKLAAQALERLLAALEDPGDEEYDPFDSLLEQAVLGALVPGQGVTRFKYDAQITAPAAKKDTGKGETKDDEDADEKSQADSGVKDQAGPGKDILPVPGEKVQYETACGEDVDYDMVLFGYARTWKCTPWVAYIHFMEKEDAEKSFGKETADLLVYSQQNQIVEGWKKRKPNYEDVEDEAQRGTRPVAVVYEIWHKEKKNVVFYAPSVKDRLLHEVDDPLELSGFFPQPQPLVFHLKRSKQTPTPLYTLYEEQAKELNRLTMRINRILHAMKVRGFYDGSLKELKNLLNSDDNTMLPAMNAAALAEQDLSRRIWMMPLKDLIVVLQQLIPARETVKNTIYEITGISDIMRGDTQASETATAQNIKNTYGTLRLNQFRKKVQLYARDCLRILGEIACKHFSVESFAKMTNLDFALPKEVEQAKKMMMYAQQMMQQLQSPMGAASPSSPGPPSPGNPAQSQQPPPIPPQLQQMVQQAQAVLQKPAWADVVGLLRDNLQRNYRIDIETNSTIAADTAEDKANIVEAVGVIGKMFQQLAPLAQQGALPVAAVKQIILTVARRFQFGRQVEDELNQMPNQLPPPPSQPGQQQQPGPSPAEQQAAAAKAQLELQVTQKRMEEEQMAGQREAQNHQYKMTQAARDEELAKAEHGLKMTQIQAQLAAISQKMQLGQMSVENERQHMVMDQQSAALATQQRAEQGQFNNDQRRMDQQNQQQMAQQKAAAAKKQQQGKPRSSPQV